ncbi:MAG: preprotein translocase subunit YajC [Thermoguttaceae bacterium]
MIRYFVYPELIVASIVHFEMLPMLSALFAYSTIFSSTIFAADGDSGLWTMFLWMGPVLLIFWFFLIRPQQRDEDRRQKMYKALKKNDKVYTVGGIVGTIYSVDLEKKEVVLKVDDNTRVKFLLSAVAAIVQESNDNKA